MQRQKGAKGQRGIAECTQLALYGTLNVGEPLTTTPLSVQCDVAVWRTKPSSRAECLNGGRQLADPLK
ncbi:MAG: hypothetical protein ACRDQZ_15635 [Mycobacteriales bacterium]